MRIRRKAAAMFGLGAKLNDEKDEHEEGKDDSKSIFTWEQTIR